jgi:hypothetical protein
LAAAVWLLLCQIGASVRWWKWGGDQKETRPLRTGLCKTREERERLREHGHAELCLATLAISRRLVFNCVRLTQKRPAVHPGGPLRGVLRGIKIRPAISCGGSNVDGAEMTSSAIVLAKGGGSTNGVMNNSGIQFVQPSE